MKVTDITTQIINLNFRNAVIVRVETDEDVTGIAETVMKRNTKTVEQSVLSLKRYLVGKDPTEIENHATLLRCTTLRYLNVASRAKPPADWHWIYVPERKYPFYRVNVFSSAMPTMSTCI